MTICSIDEKNRQTVLGLIDKWTDNISENLQEIRKSPDILEIAIPRQPKPALIIASGPSLTKTQLLQVDTTKYDVFCVSKILTTLLDNKIKPKYVVSIDAEEADTQFIQNYEDGIGLFGITIHPSTSKKWKGNRYYFIGDIDNNCFPNISYIFHLLTKKTRLAANGNVGSCALNLATLLGHKEIVLLGMDLSFPTMNSMCGYFHNFDMKTWTKDQYKIGYNPYFNCRYYCDSTFSTYLQSTRSWCKLFHDDGIQIYNCTEGGGLYGAGIKCKTFEEYLCK